MMEKMPVPSTEKTSAETSEKEEVNEDIFEGAAESEDPDLEASKLRAAYELGIDASDLPKTDLGAEIVEKLEEDNASGGVLSKMPGVRNFVKAAILTVGLSAMGGGLANKSFAAEGTESNKPDTTMVDSNEATEQRAAEIRAYQSKVNNAMEKASIDFGRDVSDEQLNNFQAKGWEWAAYVVDNNASNRDFLRGLADMYKEHFAEQLQSMEDARQEQATQLAQELASESIDIESIDGDWLWNNVDKVFYDGSDVYVVKASSSRDMQIAMKKAQLNARASLVGLMSTSGSMTLIGSRSVQRNFRRTDDGAYEAVVIMELPLEKNIK